MVNKSLEWNVNCYDLHGPDEPKLLKRTCPEQLSSELERLKPIWEKTIAIDSLEQKCQNYFRARPYDLRAIQEPNTESTDGDVQSIFRLEIAGIRLTQLEKKDAEIINEVFEKFKKVKDFLNLVNESFSELGKDWAAESESLNSFTPDSFLGQYKKKIDIFLSKFESLNAIFKDEDKLKKLIDHKISRELLKELCSKDDKFDAQDLIISCFKKTQRASDSDFILKKFKQLPKDLFGSGDAKYSVVESFVAQFLLVENRTVESLFKSKGKFQEEFIKSLREQIQPDRAILIANELAQILFPPRPLLDTSVSKQTKNKGFTLKIEGEFEKILADSQENSGGPKLSRFLFVLLVNKIQGKFKEANKGQLGNLDNLAEKIKIDNEDKVVSVISNNLQLILEQQWLHASARFSNLHRIYFLYCNRILQLIKATSANCEIIKESDLKKYVFNIFKNLKPEKKHYRDRQARKEGDPKNKSKGNNVQDEAGSIITPKQTMDTANEILLTKTVFSLAEQGKWSETFSHYELAHTYPFPGLTAWSEDSIAGLLEADQRMKRGFTFEDLLNDVIEKSDELSEPNLQNFQEFIKQILDTLSDKYFKKTFSEIKDPVQVKNIFFDALLVINEITARALSETQSLPNFINKDIDRLSEGKNYKQQLKDAFCAMLESEISETSGLVDLDQVKVILGENYVKSTIESILAHDLINPQTPMHKFEYLMIVNVANSISQEYREVPSIKNSINELEKFLKKCFA